MKSATARAPWRRPLFRALVLAALGCVLLSYALAARSAARPTPPSAPPSIPVGVETASRRDLPIWLAGVGAVQPLNTVNVKVRVDGQLQQVAFTEGQEVRGGDLLAQIDPRPLQAQLKQAEANLAKDQAQAVHAQADLKRFNDLAQSGYAPKMQIDQLRAQAASMDATVQADRAAIDAASLQLDFARITSPIDGRVGLRQIDPGAIVHASDQNGLVTVTQMQPIAVLFSLPQDALPDIRAAMKDGGVPDVVAETRDGKRPLSRGKLAVLDSQVDASNGQIRLKAQFTNEDRALWPGEFVSARLLVRTEKNVVVVPARAVLRGQNGPYLYVVKPDQTVELRNLTVGATVDGFTAIRTGVQADDKIVVDGQSRLVAGTRIEAKKPAQTSASVAGGAVAQ
ncbi:MAG: efflux transporter periplasmic adaptor subunit [Rhodospirillales bacterium]|nr:efflux transporter periplasmic adaptor subunit [Rhodospirillales bacterium]